MTQSPYTRLCPLRTSHLPAPPHWEADLQHPSLERYRLYSNHTTLLPFPFLVWSWKERDDSFFLSHHSVHSDYQISTTTCLIMLGQRARLGHWFPWPFHQTRSGLKTVARYGPQPGGTYRQYYDVTSALMSVKTIQFDKFLEAVMWVISFEMEMWLMKSRFLFDFLGWCVPFSLPFLFL